MLEMPCSEVCSTEGEDFGVGKTAVLDAVHRAFTLLGHTCVAIHLRSLSQASWAGSSLFNS